MLKALGSGTPTLALRLLFPGCWRSMSSGPDSVSMAPGAAKQRTHAPISHSSAAAAAASDKRRRLAGPAALGTTSRGGHGKKPEMVYQEPAPGPVLLPGGCHLSYRTDLLPASEAAALLRTLLADLPWEQRSVRVMGRVVPQPRLIAYQADGPELAYTYSGTTLAPAPWHPAVAALKAWVEAAAGTTFNCCLLNLYRSGADSIAWHSDSERLFGERPVIASVSLGAPREFLLRRNADHADKFRFRLGGGALLVMGPGVQQEWMHSVPRRASAQLGERVSLTFRRITTPEGAGKGGAA